MSTVTKSTRPATTQPLKTSSATGAVLATLGFNKSIPLMHSAQGCSAFAKVYLIQHYREPMPIQNTAIDQIAAVMGTEDNLIEALQTLTDKHHPELITVINTGLAEMQGADIAHTIHRLKTSKTNTSETTIVPVSCPDFKGSLQTGFAATVDAVIRHRLHNSNRRVKIPKQVNLLCGSALTPADVDSIAGLVRQFGLNPIIVPDISQSLDGHLETHEHCATSTGGTTLADLDRLHQSDATLVIGESLFGTAKWLQEAFRIPAYFFTHVMGIRQTDAFITALKEISGTPVPGPIKRDRQRLQDALLDTHFVLAGSHAALALEPDALVGFDTLLHEAGVRVPVAVTTTTSVALQHCHADHIIIGDLHDLADVNAERLFMIGNTHCAHIYEPAIPVIRFGFPCHDHFGTADMLSVGYQGARELLFRIANRVQFLNGPGPQPFVSPYHFSKAEVVPV